MYVVHTVLTTLVLPPMTSVFVVYYTLRHLHVQYIHTHVHVHATLCLFLDVITQSVPFQNILNLTLYMCYMCTAVSTNGHGDTIKMYMFMQTADYLALFTAFQLGLKDHFH